LVDLFIGKVQSSSFLSADEGKRNGMPAPSAGKFPLDQSHQDLLDGCALQRRPCLQLAVQWIGDIYGGAHKSILA
jgi:hypothetical protein